MCRFLSLSIAVVTALVASRLSAQVATPDPDVRGPARRAAGAAAEALGAPGVEDRIENREQRRDLRNADENPNAAARADARIDNADRWRYTYHNNQWWYYTPQKSWMVYRDNNWGAYNPPAVRYSTGYRGTDGTYTTRRGLFGRRVYSYSNPNRATIVGENLGADIGAAAGGAAGAQRGANLGEAVGETVDAAREPVGPTLPPAVPPDSLPPANPTPNP
jgi:hypothetical protein